MTPAARKALATIRRKPSTTEEIAAAVGIAPASVKVIVSRHLKRQGVVLDKATGCYRVTEGQQNYSG